MCVWLPPSQRQLAEMLHKRHSIVNCRITGMKRIEATGYSVPSSCVDRGRAAASSRHSNASVRGRNRLQSERAADVGEITSVVYLCLSSSSDDHLLSHSCLGTGMRFGTQNKFCHYRESLVHSISLIASRSLLVCWWEQYHDTATSGADYLDLHKPP